MSVMINTHGLDDCTFQCIHSHLRPAFSVLLNTDLANVYLIPAMDAALLWLCKLGVMWIPFLEGTEKQLEVLK